MSHSHRSRGGSSLVGLVLLFIGLGILFNNLGLGEFSRWLSLGWPVILMVAVVWLSISRQMSLRTAGFLFIVAILFQVDALNLIKVSAFALLWPLLIIWIGIQAFFRWEDRDTTVSKDDDKLDIFTLFSGSVQRSNSKAFLLARVTALFGGSQVDLRQVQVAEDGAVVDLFVAFGGVEIFVPKDAQVRIEATPLFGGIEDQTHVDSSVKKPQIIRVRGTVLFGGIEIKH